MISALQRKPPLNMWRTFNLSTRVCLMLFVSVALLCPVLAEELPSSSNRADYTTPDSKTYELVYTGTRVYVPPPSMWNASTPYSSMAFLDDVLFLDLVNITSKIDGPLQWSVNGVINNSTTTTKLRVDLRKYIPSASIGAILEIRVVIPRSTPQQFYVRQGSLNVALSLPADGSLTMWDLTASPPAPSAIFDSLQGVKYRCQLSRQQVARLTTTLNQTAVFTLATIDAVDKTILMRSSSISVSSAYQNEGITSTTLNQDTTNTKVLYVCLVAPLDGSFELFVNPPMEMQIRPGGLSQEGIINKILNTLSAAAAAQPSTQYANILTAGSLLHGLRSADPSMAEAVLSRAQSMLVTGLTPRVWETSVLLNAVQGALRHSQGNSTLIERSLVIAESISSRSTVLRDIFDKTIATLDGLAPRTSKAVTATSRWQVLQADPQHSFLSRILELVRRVMRSRLQTPEVALGTKIFTAASSVLSAVGVAQINAPSALELRNVLVRPQDVSTSVQGTVYSILVVVSSAVIPSELFKNADNSAMIVYSTEARPDVTAARVVDVTLSGKEGMGVSTWDSSIGAYIPCKENYAARQDLCPLRGGPSGNRMLLKWANAPPPEQPKVDQAPEKAVKSVLTMALLISIIGTCAAAICFFIVCIYFMCRRNRQRRRSGRPQSNTTEPTYEINNNETVRAVIFDTEKA